MRRARRAPPSVRVPADKLWTFDGLRRVTAAEGRQLVAQLNRLAERAREGHATQAIELVYQGREGWVVARVGLMRTDDVDAFAAEAGTRAHAKLVDALEEAWRGLTSADGDDGR